MLFGTGGQARTQLEALLHVRDLAEVRICGRDFARTQAFAVAMQQEFSHFNTRMIAVDDGNAAVRDADIITAATTSNTPVFDGHLSVLIDLHQNNYSYAQRPLFPPLRQDFLLVVGLK